MLHFDKHFTAIVRNAGAPLLPLWRFLASRAVWIFIVTTIVLIIVDRSLFWVIAIPVVITQVITVLLQEIIRRDRPPLSVASIVMWTRTPSFPSAHASTSTAFAITISAAVLPYGDAGVIVAAAAFILAFSIAISRVMVGVHYLGDITVGVVLGAVIVAGVIGLG